MAKKRGRQRKIDEYASGEMNFEIDDEEGNTDEEERTPLPDVIANATTVDDNLLDQYVLFLVKTAEPSVKIAELLLKVREKKHKEDPESDADKITVEQLCTEIDRIKKTVGGGDSGRPK